MCYTPSTPVMYSSSSPHSSNERTTSSLDADLQTIEHEYGSGRLRRQGARNVKLLTPFGNLGEATHRITPAVNLGSTSTSLPVPSFPLPIRNTARMLTIPIHSIESATHFPGQCLRPNPKATRDVRGSLSMTVPSSLRYRSGLKT